MGLFKSIFGANAYSNRELKRIEPIKNKVLELDEEYQKLSDAELKAKTQEFKDRLTYDIENSVLTHQGPRPADSVAEESLAKDVNHDVEERNDGVQALLFKTATCPNCHIAGSMLDEAGIKYQTVDANETQDLVQKYGIMQAPTLVLVDGDSYEKLPGVSDIRGWLMNKN